MPLSRENQACLGSVYEEENSHLRKDNVEWKLSFPYKLILISLWPLLFALSLILTDPVQSEQ